MGEVLAGKYRLERIIGRGGMGIVVAAHHVQLDERVAIKFLLPGMASSAEVMSRFQREARTAIKIKSEHIARVLDVSQLPDGTPYMVMEYLEGKELAALIEEEKHLSPEDTSELIIQACEAIVEAHALGIVHRDLKPANLFLVQHADGLPSVKVLDFGISKNAAGDVTSTQSLLGSPLYMSPEQMHSSKSVDARTDVWSLGVIMYECVAGQVPTYSESFPELVYKVVNEDPTPLTEKIRDVPPEFAAVVHRCLSRDREKRYPHVGELAIALLPFASERAAASVDKIMRIAESSGMTAGVIPGASGSSPRISTDPKASAVPTSEPGKRGASLFAGQRRSGAHPRASSKISAPVDAPPLEPAEGKSSDLRGTKGAWTTPATPPSNGKMKIAIAGTFAATVLIAVLGFLAFKQRQSPIDVPAALVPTPSDVASEAPHPSAVASAIPLPSAIVSAEPVASAAVSTSRPVALPGVAPVVAPRLTPGPAAPASAAKPVVNCNPPYTFDPEGNRVYKKECL